MDSIALWLNPHGFRHKFLRDLAWAVGSPQMLSEVNSYSIPVVTDEFCKRELEEYLTFIKLRDQHDTSFGVSSPHPLLGFYFESLVNFWLNERPGTDELHSNISIKQGNITIGELDFVFHEAGIWHHWEVAVKFYLGYGNTLNTSSWLGPSANDRLDIKLERTAQVINQISAKGAEMLYDLGVEISVAAALIKGRLFFHITDQHRVLPDDVSPSVETGEWLRISELEMLPSGYYWRILDRKDWITVTPSAFEPNNQHLSLNLLTQQLIALGKQRFSRMITCYVKSETLMIPVKQYMVVDDAWPYTSTEMGS
jgi:uncharacterized protein